jgi:hypothetical protein
LPLGDGVLDPEPPYVFYISAQAGDPGACWQWITFLSQDPRAITFLPLRQDLVRGDAWRDYAGAEVADAWGQMLAGEGEAWLPLDARGADTERYWLNEALAQVLAGRDPVAALDEAQDRGAVVYDCMQDSDGSFEDWIACGQQADPDVRLP